MRKTIWWFTIIEVLIIVIILGILVLLGLPKMRTLQTRTRDVVRQWDLNQLNTALQNYRTQNQSYPTTSWSINTVLANLMPVYIRSLPSDPQSNLHTTHATQSALWSYLYIPVENNQWYVLMAINESWKGNRISNTNSTSLTGVQPWFISPSITIKDLQYNICLSTTSWPIARNNRKCTANLKQHEIKFIRFSN